jgi:hypothetical protein
VEQFAALHDSSLPKSANQPLVHVYTSAAENEMWDDYEANGAEFSAGADVEMAERARYKEAEKMFGLWNASEMAQELGGFETKNGLNLLQDDEDEEILSELLENARLSSLFGCKCLDIN